MKRNSKAIMLFLSVVVGMTFFVYTYLQQEEDFKRLGNEKMELEKELRINQRELEVLKRELANIESPESKEKMIREKLGMIKKDEIQYVIKQIEKTDVAE